MKNLSICLILLFLFCQSRTFYKAPHPGQVEQEYFQNNPDLPELDKKCITEGTIELGIRSETVKFLLGLPAEIQFIVHEGDTLQKWNYKRRFKKTDINIKELMVDNNSIIIEIFKFR
jgi:hypothetical protein